MLQSFKLLLPALIPSWRFFDVIAPSPRIEFALLKTAQDTPQHWQEFRPRAERLSILTMLKCMIFNPQWNETLFLVSCAERLMQSGEGHSKQEILKRIKADLRRSSVDSSTTPYFQFRLIFLSRQGAQMRKHVTFISLPHRIFESGEG